MFNRLAEEFLEHERGKLMSDWLSFKDDDPKKTQFLNGNISDNFEDVLIIQATNL